MIDHPSSLIPHPSSIEYAELHAHSYFSLLDGACSPEALVAGARELGLNALALTDHNGLAGAIRFWKAAQGAGMHPIFGAEVTLTDDQHLTLLAENQDGYARLCRLLTAAHLQDTPTDHTGALTTDPKQWPGKGKPVVTWELLEQHHRGLLALSGCWRGPVAAALRAQQPEQAKAMAGRLRDIFGREQVWIELQHHSLPEDDRLIRALLQVSRSLNLPCVATNNVHYTARAGSRLRDALIAIDQNLSLADARRAGHLPYNSNYYLAAPQEMAARFAEIPQALRGTIEIARRCQVALDFSQHRLPTFAVPGGASEFAYLYQLCHAGLPKRYPELKPAVLKQLAHELSVIEQAGLAGYFLIVWDIVRFAREQGIRCQGRGSAANSIVAYLLGITSVDPLAHNLLFERFLSADRYTTPDIDIDFAADRREEVIQYVYERYGASHTAMVCNVVTYQARSAVRDLGKALGFPLPVIDRLSKSIEGHSPVSAADQLLKSVETDATVDHPIRLLTDLMRQIEDCPRHLAIHVGGMLITARPLDEIVPLERATMPGRVVCQWNKDSVEDAGLIKIDILGLRTLGLVAEALGYIEGKPPDLDALSLDDPAIYEMLQQADTIGAFQVESRAQQQMLPRLKPTRFEDIAIEVAIVRPGPIQGGAVHPYLRRRSGVEPVSYTHPLLEPALRETLGVMLFQEQVIRVAMVAAGFSAGEADMLRRAMSRSRSFEAMEALRDRFIQGAAANGIERAIADDIFQQLEGFAGYGFCKSHAASFALIAYQTMHLKRYHAPAFYAALLNQQPMGFYSSEVIIGDAQRHGVPLLPPNINRSAWKYTLERTADGKLALRMGLRTILGLGEQGWQRIQSARENGLFGNLRDFCIRTRLPKPTVSDLIRAGTLDAFGARRTLLWQLGEIDYRPEELPLAAPVLDVSLPALEDTEATLWEYELLGLSPSGQIMRHHRAAFARAGILSTAEVKAQPEGKMVRVGGMAVVKQRPGTAHGVLFVSLEDETGLLDLVVKPNVYERFRPLLRHQPFVLVEGIVQKASGAINVVVTRAFEFTLFANSSPADDARITRTRDEYSPPNYSGSN
ncbi:MAG: error-prone DNA polymerase [Chloroflexi bacterium]|nr:error-prone DNA polymerase [Chloroflexota bacterium]